MTESLSSLAEDFMRKRWRNVRDGILKVLDKVEKGHNVVFEAPTGYGKTTITLVLADAIGSGKTDIASRVIHVLPLRSIIQDLREKLLDSCKNGYISTCSIGAQDMDFHDSPFFTKKVNITTLDTFVSNLFKLPPVEMRNVLNDFGAHYELPRAMIYSSIVIFDEFHLFNEEGRTLTASLASLEALESAGVPFIIMSATLSDSIKDLIKNKIKNIDFVSVNDFKIDRKVYVEFSNEEDYCDRAEKYIKEGKRVLVILNTRTKAIEVYNNLIRRGLPPILIHSKFNQKDRVNIMNEVRSNAKLVVATQVIEAGVDTSFDVLITESCPASNLVQRAGRVARYGGEGIVVIEPFSGNVYDKEIVEETEKIVKNTKTIDSSILINEKISHDPNLEHDLVKIDSSVYASYKDTFKLMRVLCALTREVSLVLGFPSGSTSSEDAIPLNEYEAEKLLQSGMKPVRLRDGKLQVIDNYTPSKDVCLSLDFLMKGIDGIMIKGYDSKTGGIIE